MSWAWGVAIAVGFFFIGTQAGLGRAAVLAQRRARYFHRLGGDGRNEATLADFAHELRGSLDPKPHHSE